MPVLLAVGVPSHCFNTGLRVRLHGGEVLEFPCAFFVKRPQVLLILTPWSGLYVVDRGIIAEFAIFAPQRDAAATPQVNRPIGIAPPKAKPRPPQRAKVIDFPSTGRAPNADMLDP